MWRLRDCLATISCRSNQEMKGGVVWEVDTFLGSSWYRGRIGWGTPGCPPGEFCFVWSQKASPIWKNGDSVQRAIVKANAGLFPHSTPGTCIPPTGFHTRTRYITTCMNLATKVVSHRAGVTSLHLPSQSMGFVPCAQSQPHLTQKVFTPFTTTSLSLYIHYVHENGVYVRTPPDGDSSVNLTTTTYAEVCGDMELVSVDHSLCYGVMDH